VSGSGAASEADGCNFLQYGDRLVWAGSASSKVVLFPHGALTSALKRVTENKSQELAGSRKKGPALSRSFLLSSYDCVSLSPATLFFRSFAWLGSSLRLGLGLRLRP
jgi:hypothetical protein